MKILGIIAEYNPMHLGHIYHINESVKKTNSTHVVAAISGHFMQRGGVSIFDKWSKAKIALLNGVDLVLELPTMLCTQSAEIFASSGISLLDKISIIDEISFGIEDSNLDNIVEVIDQQNLYENEIDNKIKTYISQGFSYPKSYANALKDLNIKEIKMPNDMLAFEYIKSLKKFKSKIKYNYISRCGAGYNSNSLAEEYISASAIRDFVLNESNLNNISKFLPKETINKFQDNDFKFDKDFYNLIKYKIISEKKDLKNIFLVNEGIENLFEEKILQAFSMEDFLIKAKTGRYTMNRIKRTLFNILLNINKTDMTIAKDMSFSTPYCRILGFNSKGREILSLMKKSSQIPIINKTAKYKPNSKYEQILFEKDILATKIYNLIKRSKYYDDYKTSPIIV